MSKQEWFRKKYLLASLGLVAVFFVGATVNAQSTPAQQLAGVRDNDTTRRELTSFDSFMDGHPEIAEQVRKNPSLVNDEQFVEKHPALQQYLQEHPGVREEMSENPNAFMWQERRVERQETRRELTNLDRFMDSHPEIAEQLRRNPSLVNDEQFVQKHPALQEFLQAHSGVAQELRQNPNAFMQEEQRFDQRQDARDGDRNRGELASMDRFLDGHPEIAEQLRKDPSLVQNKEFVEKHAALQTYLQQHPQVREEITENPNGFMRQEARFDRHEGFTQNERGFDRDPDHQAMASFGQFLGRHANIAAQVSKDPALLNNKEFMETHPELREYLSTHPGVEAEMKENPQAFMQSVQQMNKPLPKPTTVERPPLKQQ